MTPAAWPEGSALSPAELAAAGLAAEFCAQPETFAVFTAWVAGRRSHLPARPDAETLRAAAGALFINTAVAIIRGGEPPR